MQYKRQNTAAMGTYQLACWHQTINQSSCQVDTSRWKNAPLMRLAYW